MYFTNFFDLFKIRLLLEVIVAKIACLITLLQYPR